MDSLLCSDAPKFVSALLLSLSSMLHIELPHVNVLSKADLAQRIHGDEFRLTDVSDDLFELSELHGRYMEYLECRGDVCLPHSSCAVPRLQERSHFITYSHPTYSQPHSPHGVPRLLQLQLAHPTISLPHFPH